MATLSPWRAFTIPTVCIALLFLGGAPDRLFSQGAMRGSVESFAREYVAALGKKDTAAIRARIHPLARACMSGDAHDYLDAFLAREASRDSGAYDGPFTITVTAVEQPAATPALSALVHYAVRPTHQLRIDLQRLTPSLTILREIVLSDGRWFLVLPCPTADGLQRFREAEQARRDRAIAVDRLVAELKEPLRSRLLALLRDGKRFDAIKEYRAATGTNLTTADA